MQTARDKNIWHYIIHLLHTNDCVVVPNFGGFVLQIEYATIDSISEIIYPTSRKISFNQKLNLNDGLLAMCIADELQISYVDSIKLIELELSVFNKSIEENKRIEIDKLGTFILGIENNIQFIPALRSNFAMSSFGLQPLQLHSNSTLHKSTTLDNPSYIKQHAARKNEVAKTVENKESNKPVRKKRSSIWYTVLATFMIIVLLFNAYILLETYPISALNNSISKMNIASKFTELFSTTKTPIEVKPVIIPEKIIVKPEVVAIDNNKVSEKAITTEIPADEKIETNTTDSIYYIVVGAFRHNKKAIVLSQQYKNNGYNLAEVVKPKRYHFKLVTVGNFSSMHEAMSTLNEVQQETPDAWIYQALR